MKRLFAALIFLFAATSAFAQDKLQPLKWSVSLSKTEAKTCEVLEATFTANIPKGLHIYSNDYECKNGGPNPAIFTFKPDAGIELLGGAKAVGSHKEHDDIFECDVTVFHDKAVFVQKFKYKAANIRLSGTLEYQVCSESQCFAFEYDFTVHPVKITGSNCDPKDQNTPPAKDKTIDTASKTVVPVIETPEDSLAPKAMAADTGACKPIKYAGSDDDTEEPSTDLWAFFLLAFGSGLVSLITPCVFPMIPMTVSFFLKTGISRRKAIRDAMIYGFSIIAIYTVIGTVFSLAFGAEAANFISTHWLPNVFFFVVFVVFAFSFFGMFEITLPSSIVNRVDRQADKGGMLGIFFMAFTLVLVSFSCTGPIAGTILVESSKGHFIKPVIGMLGFSLAFALPFTLFAIFPQWLNNLPKSGGWLNSVKVVLGFLELALGLKFLSVADQTYHWHILDREVYIALWIVIFFLMGVYLLGKLKFAHDSDHAYIAVPRLVFAIVTFSFVVYLIPGLFGAKLPGLAGYLPPMSSHGFDLPGMVREAAGQSDELCDKPKHSDILHLPHGLKGYYDYKQGMECARTQNKPVLIDFTGHGCVNCRKMEEKVWADPRVLKRLEEDFIIISLYVDDKTELPESEWITSRVDGKVKKSIGKINADFQICRFDNNAQPYYCPIDQDGELLTIPRGTMEYNVDAFIDFLDKAKENYIKRNPKAYKE